jgi:hypothetical protein
MNFNVPVPDLPEYKHGEKVHEVRHEEKNSMNSMNNFPFKLMT